MADKYLPATKQDELFEEFEKIAVERVGQGKPEEFRRRLEELGRVYLNHEAGHGHGH
ncbi:MAG: hypothetical protein HPY50_01365 [Firmicutes bacterium]|nr:hypothetical protein [Bacillota bacterium]